MAVFIADTDVLIDFLSNTGAAERIRLELESGDLRTTAITAFELLAGARESRHVSAVERLLDALSILPADVSAARRAARIQRELASKGTGIGMADALISGICLNHNAILLSRNRKHFRHVPGLKLGLD